MLYKDKARDKIIVCPHCGYEYLPAEIFIPKAFFGSPSYIDRNTIGEIEIFEGTTMDTTENYICDKCGKEFTVTSELRFRTNKKENKSMDEVYVSNIYHNKISLFEDLDIDGTNN